MGLFWAAAGSFDPFGVWDILLANAFYEGQTPATVVRFRRFILGPFGATVAGFYWAAALIVRIPFRRREPWAFMDLAKEKSLEPERLEAFGRDDPAETQEITEKS